MRTAVGQEYVVEEPVVEMAPGTPGVVPQMVAVPSNQYITVDEATKRRKRAIWIGILLGVGGMVFIPKAFNWFSARDVK